jgi:myo-inositol 2-dehydrogenase / D-chiro-inositol 1-dehydrogenase
MLNDRRMAGPNRFPFLPDSDRYLSRREEPQFRLAQIGCGTNGLEHIRVAEFEGRAITHGIYDPNPRSIEAAQATLQRLGSKRELVTYPNLSSLCEDPEIDALIISTPNYTHIDVIRAVVSSGKHILLEKPMATTVEDAKEIEAISRDYPAVFQIGLQYRYKSIYAESILEVLKNRAIGKVKTISMREHRIPFLDKVGQWNKFAKYSGGTLVEKCCHYFDLMNLFSQSRPKRVIASGGQAVNFLDFEYDGKKSDIMDHAYVIVEYQNGIRACLDLNMFSPLFNEEMIVSADEGWLRVSEQQNFLSVEGIQCTMEIYRGENKTSRVSNPQYPKHIEACGHHGSTFIEHINFVDGMMGIATNAATVEEGFWSIVVGCAAQKSIAKNRPVEITELIA